MPAPPEPRDEHVRGADAPREAERLTDEERRYLARGDASESPQRKTLRIIDQLAAECERLRAELEAAQRGERDAVQVADDNWVTHQRVVYAESRLAAANALLERVRKNTTGTKVWEEIDAHLAGQEPVAERTEAELTDSERDSWKGRVAFWKHTAENVAHELEVKSTRTEAEQRVLDAMAEVPDNNVRAIVGGSINLRGLPKAFAAELARRGLKP